MTKLRTYVCLRVAKEQRGRQRDQAAHQPTSTPWPARPQVKCLDMCGCAAYTIATAARLGLEPDPAIPWYTEPPAVVQPAVTPRQRFRKAANKVCQHACTAAHLARTAHAARVCA